jgi:chaperonin GroEL
LKGGLCIVKAGGLSDVEISECRDRIEDSLFAVRAALEDGYVIGGGLALFNASQDLEYESLNSFERTGFQIIQHACQEPAKQIITNALGDPARAISILEKYKSNDPSIGFNSRSKEFENLIDCGIIDPVKVVKNSLQFGTGVASILLTTDTAIILEDRKAKIF